MKKQQYIAESIYIVLSFFRLFIQRKLVVDM